MEGWGASALACPHSLPEHNLRVEVVYIMPKEQGSQAPDVRFLCARRRPQKC